MGDAPHTVEGWFPVIRQMSALMASASPLTARPDSVAGPVLTSARTSANRRPCSNAGEYARPKVYWPGSPAMAINGKPPLRTLSVGPEGLGVRVNGQSGGALRFPLRLSARCGSGRNTKRVP
jgi:hypothetical protein